MRPGGTLARRLVLSVIVVCVTVLPFGGLLGFRIGRTMVETAIQRGQQDATAGLMTTVDRNLANANNDIELVAEDGTTEEWLEQIADGVSAPTITSRRKSIELSQMALLSGPWQELVIVDTTGKILVSSTGLRVGESITRDPAEREVYERAKRGLINHSDIVVPAGRTRPTLFFAAPIRNEEDGNSRLLGVALGWFALPVLNQILDELPAPNVPRLTRADGLVIATHTELAKAILHDRISAGELDPRFLRTIAEEKGALGYTGNGWRMIIDVPKETIYAPVRAMAEKLAILIGTLNVLLIVAASLFARRYTAPIVELTNAAESLSAGAFETRLDIRTGDEVERLAVAFNEMAGRVQNHIESLEQTKRQLTDAEKFLHSTIDHIPDALAVKRASDFRYVLANLTFAQLPGQSIIGKTDFEIFSADVAGERRAEDETVIRNRAKVRCSDFTLHNDSGERLFHRSKLPQLDDHGNVEYIVEIAEDVTEKHREEEIIRQRETAVAANMAKSAFLARMSHEIRTPMNGVLGMSSLLAQTSLDAEQREYADTIHTSATLLLTVINDILDLSRIEAGKMKLIDEPFSPRATLSESARVLAVAAAARSIALVVDVDPAVPEMIRGDSGRIRQMILNLASNAVKFTESGEVVISASVVERGTDSAVLQFSVRDTGIGIAQGEIDQLFEPFQQVDSSNSRRHKGTGLGLVITRRLAEQMGGRAWAESTPGEGSTFFFTARFGAEAEAGDTRTELCGMRVVLVEQNAAALAAIARMLVAHGAEALPFADCDEVEAYFTGHACTDVRVILEATNGVAAMEERIQGTLARGVPPERIVMLVQASQLHDGLREFAGVGVTRYLVKPVSEERLLSVLMDAPSGPVRAVSAEAPLRPMRILVAEDNLINQRVITKFLARDHHDVVLTNDGAEAVAAFQRQSFDVILMDVQMPVMDGITATAVIRDLEVGLDLHTPIIALTAHSTEGDRDRCLAAGMDGYVAKPIDPAGLRQALVAAMHQKKGAVA